MSEPKARWGFCPVKLFLEGHAVLCMRLWLCALLSNVVHLKVEIFMQVISFAGSF